MGRAGHQLDRHATPKYFGFLHLYIYLKFQLTHHGLSQRMLSERLLEYGFAQ